VSREWPEGCRDCIAAGAPDLNRRHFGKGLCGPHYKKRARAGTMGELDTVASFVNDPDAIPLGPVDPEAALQVDPVERVPGSVNSPVAGAEPASPIVEETKKKRSLFTKREPRPKREKLPKTNEKTPGGRTPKRVSTADSVEDIWIGVGGMLERAGRHAPLGRYLQWQSPAAGEIVDGVVADTYVDRKVLQPAVKARSSLDAIAAVAGPPLIIMAIERSPEKFTFNTDGGVNHPLLPILASSIRSSLPTLLPAMKKAQAKKDKVDEAIREMFPDLLPGEDVVNSVLEKMFDGWFNGVVPDPEDVNAGT
jgi:hypothetical protein